MYIIYPVVSGQQKNKRIGVIYRNVRTFMMNRGIVLGNGFFVPDSVVPECLAKLEKYKANWVEADGSPDDFHVLQFELLCNDMPTYNYCCSAVKKCILSRTDKTLALLSIKNKVTDIRQLRGLVLDISYTETFVDMFPMLKEPLEFMKKASVAFPLDKNTGMSYLTKARELLCGEDKE